MNGILDSTKKLANNNATPLSTRPSVWNIIYNLTMISWKCLPNAFIAVTIFTIFVIESGVIDLISRSTSISYPVLGIFGK